MQNIDRPLVLSDIHQQATRDDQGETVTIPYEYVKFSDLIQQHVCETIRFYGLLLDKETSNAANIADNEAASLLRYHQSMTEEALLKSIGSSSDIAAGWLNDESETIEAPLEALFDDEYVLELLSRERLLVDVPEAATSVISAAANSTGHHEISLELPIAEKEPQLPIHIAPEQTDIAENSFVKEEKRQRAGLESPHIKRPKYFRAPVQHGAKCHADAVLRLRSMRYGRQSPGEQSCRAIQLLAIVTILLWFGHSVCIHAHADDQPTRLAAAIPERATANMQSHKSQSVHKGDKHAQHRRYHSTTLVRL